MALPQAVAIDKTMFIVSLLCYVKVKNTLDLSEEQFYLSESLLEEFGCFFLFWRFDVDTQFSAEGDSL